MDFSHCGCSAVVWTRTSAGLHATVCEVWQLWWRYDEGWVVVAQLITQRRCKVVGLRVGRRGKKSCMLLKLMALAHGWCSSLYPPLLRRLLLLDASSLPNCWAGFRVALMMMMHLQPTTACVFLYPLCVSQAVCHTGCGSTDLACYHIIVTTHDTTHIDDHVVVSYMLHERPRGRRGQDV